MIMVKGHLTGYGLHGYSSFLTGLSNVVIFVQSWFFVVVLFPYIVVEWQSTRNMS